MTLTKIPFLGLNHDDDDSIAPLGTCRNARNVMPAGDGSSSAGSLRTLRRFSLQVSTYVPSGTNLCVGAFEDDENSKVIIFLYNSNGNHGVYGYDPNTDTPETFLQGSELNFTTSTNITGIGVVEDLLYWSDGVNPQRVINMTRNYSSFTEDEIRLHKKPPLQQPSFSSGRGRSTDSSKSYNNISDNNFQFAVRYKYLDNEYSTISPYSLVSAGETISDPNDNTNNKISVNINMDTEVTDSIKQVDLLVRSSQSENWKIWKQVTSGFKTFQFTEDFYNDETFIALSEEEGSKLQESIPLVSDSLAVFKNRVFLTKDQEGYDVNENSFTVSASETLVSATDVPSFKENGLYNIGVIFTDGYFVSSVYGVISKKITDNKTISSSDVKMSVNGNNLTCSVTGTSPSWATHFKYVVSDEQYYSEYAQYPVNVLFYVSDKNPDISYSSPFIDDGSRIYYGTTSNPSPSQFTYLHLQIPRDVPFIPQVGDFVRIKSDVGVSKIEEVIDIIGDRLVVNDFDVSNWDTVFPSGNNKYLLIEIFRRKTESSPVFYEGGGSWISLSSGFSSRRITGDTYRVDRISAEDNLHQYNKIDTVIAPTLDNDTRFGFAYLIESESVVESPTKIMKRGLIDSSVEVETTIRFGNIPIGFEPVIRKPSYVLEYNKSFPDFGRLNARVIDANQQEFDNVIAYSNTYVEGTNVNGLSTFDNLNRYALPSERTKITKLQPANQVLLAICERSTSTLYVNENVIVSADGESQITKSDDVIGYDRELRGGYGTIHPESVVENEGRVYWFDANSGEVLRYDLNGITPIGSVYKMRSYFRTKGKQYLDSSNKVYGGFDPYLQMYYLTFSEHGSVDSETIGFIDRQGQERWVSFYDFFPERYVKLNNKIFSFNKGLMYEQNPTEGEAITNKFYGSESFPSVIKVLHNENYSKNKIYEGISQETSTPVGGVNQVWNVTITNRQGQETDLVASDFKEVEGVWYANILRDKNTNPDLLSGNQIAIRHGKLIRGKTAEIELTLDAGDSFLGDGNFTIDFVNVEYQVSLGQRNN